MSREIFLRPRLTKKGFLVAIKVHMVHSHFEWYFKNHFFSAGAFCCLEKLLQVDAPKFKDLKNRKRFQEF